MTEIIPVEMSNYRICKCCIFTFGLLSLTPRETVDGRVWFTVHNLFETSICLRGGNQDDGWFFVHVEFLFTVGGDRTGLQGALLSYLPFSCPLLTANRVPTQADRCSKGAPRN
jgi:mediator of RNA polymerase II transcription subunit 14